MAGTTHQIKAEAALDIGQAYRQFALVTNSEPLTMPKTGLGKKKDKAREENCGTCGYSFRRINS